MNAWSCASTPPYMCVELGFIKHRDNFTFIFYKERGMKAMKRHIWNKT
jgi:hypothetical protein